jgi:hypothetical protein
MINSNLDTALRSTYQEFDVPADQFIANQELVGEFVSAVESRLGNVQLDSCEVMRRLINLRKKGLLPRLRRGYFGRDGGSH